MPEPTKKAGNPATEAPPVLAAAGSHLYPGARGTLRGDPDPGGPCVVEFADGAVAFGRLAPAEVGMALELNRYTTVRGTAIPARRWAIEMARDGDEGRFWIRARLA